MGLWTSIRLDAKCRLTDIRRRITRSTPLTLDVDIDLLFEGIPSQYPMINAAIDLLMAESTRWGRLRVRLSVERMALPLVARLRSCSAPKLQSLSLKVNHIDIIQPTTSPSAPQILLNGAPGLVFVRLRGLALKHCRPPMTPLLTLHLDGTQFTTIPFSTFATMIGASNSLRNLSIFGDIVERQAWINQSVIQLPNLISLRLCGSSGAMYSSFLLGTNAPRLKYLILKGVQGDADLEQLWSSCDGHAREFLVEHLVFTDFDLSAVAYAKLFRMFPHIIGHASFSTLHTECQIVKTIIAAASDGDISLASSWPQLQHLQLTFNQTCSTSEILPKLIRIRDELGIPLAQVSLISPPNGSEGLSVPIHFRRSAVQQLLPAYGHSFAEDDNSPYTDYDDKLFF